MTSTQIIKSANFSTKRIETKNYKGIFGGTCNHVIGLFNSKNEVLCYEDKPYFPQGRKQAFASLIQSGDINAECFTFKSL